MSSRTILLLVEGQTEEKFVKELLKPEMPENLYLQPVIAKTAQLNGITFKGGVPKYAKIRSQIVNLLKDRTATLVTTMFDYYSLPNDFPGSGQTKGQNGLDKVQSLEKAWDKDIQDPRFRAYLSLHEFESLLFSNPSIIAQSLDQPKLAAKLNTILKKTKSPEEINNQPNTAPSARIKKLFPEYQKPFHGTLIAKRIGLSDMLNACRHFRSWFEFLKSH